VSRVPAILRRACRAGTLCGLLAAALASGAHAAGPHEHGAVALDVAVDDTRITLRMSSPLDNLIGFEHAPRNAAERQRVDAMVARLKAAEGLFRIDPGAGCARGAVRLGAPTLGLRTDTDTGETSPTSAPTAEEHADLDAEFEFECPRAAQARHIDLDLWNAFPGMQRLAVQLATPQGQSRQTLQRPGMRLRLKR
jgi:hypothetical protein